MAQRVGKAIEDNDPLIFAIWLSRDHHPEHTRRTYSMKFNRAPGKMVPASRRDFSASPREGHFDHTGCSRFNRRGICS